MSDSPPPAPGSGWVQGLDGKWQPPAPPPPPPPEALQAPTRMPPARPAMDTPIPAVAQPVAGQRTCVVCGSTHLVPVEKPIKIKQRRKFGISWIILGLLTCGIYIVIAWLAAPREKVTVSVDRYLQCQQCGARQP